jgi:hypothetical protein
MDPAAGYHNPWLTCHIPAAAGTGHSYLTSVDLGFRY